MLNDIRYALRQLRRNASFATVTILTIALGIGANTVIFSVVDAALFKPLPFRDAHELADIAVVRRRGRTEETFYMGAVTWNQIAALRAQSHIFAGIEPYTRAREMTRTDGDTTETVYVGRLSPGMWALLGFTPRVGRTFTTDDVATAAPVALISEGYWRRALGGTPSVIGRALGINQRVFTIVGVAPAAMRATPFDRTDVWLPFGAQSDRADTDPAIAMPATASVVARIRSGLSLERAERELDAAVSAMRTDDPSSRASDVDLVPLDRDRGGGASRVLLLLLGTTACVLLIACANVANLLLSRAVVRHREFAIRASVGATRMRLVRQFLIEGCVIAALGGAVAVLMASWMLDIIPALVPDRWYVFGRHLPALDLRVLAFTFVAVALTGVLTSLAPAWRASRDTTVLMARMPGHAITETPAPRRVREAFIAGQVGLSLVLVAATGLLVNSLVRMRGADPGFDLDRLAYVDISLPDTYASKQAQDRFFAELVERVRGVPQIRGAAIGTPPPAGGGGRFVPEGREHGVEDTPSLTIHTVSAGYFALTGIAIVAGRGLDREDEDPASPVAVIDEGAARRFWPDQNPIGRRFRYSPLVPWITVVGVARTIKTQTFTSPRGAISIYLTTAQQTSAQFRTLLLRTNEEPTVAFAAVKTILQQIDPAVKTRTVGLVDDLYADTMEAPRFFASVMALFAALGLLTAAVGLYGAVSYAVAQRTQEIGVRIALGADRSVVHRLVLLHALRPVCAGLILGLVGSLWLLRLLSNQLYGLGPHDPLTLSLSIVCLFVVAAAAAIVPARRATRVDPLAALRSE